MLEAHLDGDLDRHRPRIRKEHVLEPRRGDFNKAPRQPHGGLVGKPAEHHMRHRPKLPPYGLVEDRVPVAVHGTPPRSHPVDQLPPIVEPQPDTARARNRQRSLHGWHRAIRMPNVALVEIAKLVGGKCHRAWHRCTE